MPGELATQWQTIQDRFGHGDVGATLEGMAPKATSQLVLDIFELSCALSQGLYH